MALLLDNVAGRITDTNPTVLLEAGDAGRMVIRRISLVNQDATALDFKISLVYSDAILENESIDLFDDQIPANDSWAFGLLGGVLFIKVGQRLECVLDSNPTVPAHFCIDFGIVT